MKNKKMIIYSVIRKIITIKKYVWARLILLALTIFYFYSAFASVGKTLNCQSMTFNDAFLFLIVHLAIIFISTPSTN